jgi:hypothetical protein
VPFQTAFDHDAWWALWGDFVEGSRYASGGKRFRLPGYTSDDLVAVNGFGLAALVPLPAAPGFSLAVAGSEQEPSVVASRTPDLAPRLSAPSGNRVLVASVVQDDRWGRLAPRVTISVAQVDDEVGGQGGAGGMGGDGESGSDSAGQASGANDGGDFGEALGGAPSSVGATGGARDDETNPARTSRGCGCRAPGHQKTPTESTAALMLTATFGLWRARRSRPSFARFVNRPSRSKV